MLVLMKFNFAFFCLITLVTYLYFGFPLSCLPDASVFVNWPFDAFECESVVSPCNSPHPHYAHM
uniref:Uncharacterized protein n=1 Tax=Anguilla anguilla TaxID=7936 RepID=A0A0E9X8L8_ANGAN